MDSFFSAVARQRTPIIAIALAVMFAFWIAFLYGELSFEVNARLHSQSATLPTLGVVVSNHGAVAFVPILILCCYFLRERDGEQDFGIAGMFLNLLSLVLGTAVGWGLGVFLVPFDEADGAIYSKIGAGVTAFLSGFVVSHLPLVIRAQLRERPKPFLVQLGLAAAALLITGLAVTVNRTEYLETVRLERADLTTVQAAERSEIAAVRMRYEERYKVINKQLLVERARRAQDTLNRLATCRSNCGPSTPAPEASPSK